MLHAYLKVSNQISAWFLSVKFKLQPNLLMTRLIFYEQLTSNKFIQQTGLGVGNMGSPMVCG